MLVFWDRSVTKPRLEIRGLSSSPKSIFIPSSLISSSFSQFFLSFYDFNGVSVQ
jgi:hypothetical protein